MNKTISLIIVLLLSTTVQAKPAPTGGKACEIFNSYYDDSFRGILAKSRDFSSTDAELASSLARGGFESKQIKYFIAVRNNCRAHVEAMEKQYENKGTVQGHIKNKESEPSDRSYFSSDGDSDETLVSGEGWKYASNWRKLKTGMGYDEVRKILGEPHRIEGGIVAHWYFQNGSNVTFINDELQSWNEPKQ